MSASISVDVFRVRIAESGLLASESIAPYFTHPSDAIGIAKRLVHDQLLTHFQARQLLRGRHHGFFLGGKYKLLDLIGVGGMGKVYLCEQLSLHRLVAVKMLQLAELRGKKPMASLVERFYREARAVAALDHPHIVRMFDLDRIGSHPFMVMEYVDGTNLHDIVTRHGPLDPLRVAHYITQTADGLQHAYEAGLIHRDVKPSNILLDRSGVVKVLDLGLARFTQDVQRNQNITGRYERDAVLGTLDWVAPEQAEDSLQADIRSDIYSLGCTMYFMLTGSVPFPAESAPEKMAMHRTQAPAPLSGFHRAIPEGMIDVLDRMMEKDPADRYQTPREVVEALREITARPIEIPPVREMPARAVASYRIGLSPEPRPAPQENTPSPAAVETQVAPRPQPTAPDPLRRVLIGGFLAGFVGAALGGALWWLALR